jgi:hypothetical protein
MRYFFIYQAFAFILLSYISINFYISDNQHKNSNKTSSAHEIKNHISFKNISFKNINLKNNSTALLSAKSAKFIDKKWIFYDLEIEVQKTNIKAKSGIFINNMLKIKNIKIASTKPNISIEAENFEIKM